MAKSIAANAKIDLLNTLDALENITGLKGKKLADMIGCSEHTLSRMRTDPMSVSGKWILTVQALHAKEEKNRWL